ncbi:endonuclease/exonuclease/phosphatase family protein [Asticcacaulis sp. 201]|uniref:endonuclease/exonuclease/phosphatase family protein n=1 Tax=Asticcacaulis sp. 201 TaxID=3028787 RepID=UPI0029160801|nr:endonuclease/exonuclease/phosphatase family protein [Asticcacaulis sp. 201]MDV6331827.1 endonuclease/exonuclease/phosphatase family protein [Asticcacaulis sp. 201]
MRIPALICAAAFITTPAMAADTVRVMSYNVRVDVASDIPRWAERRGPMADQIKRVSPDIFGVQEAAQSAVADLAAALPDYDHYGLGRDDGKTGETTTIFYKRARFEAVDVSTQWCSATPNKPGKDADAAYPRTITRAVLRDRKTGTPLDVRNTHFDNVGVVARENCARQLQGTARAEVGHRPAVVIVMGDFNSGPDSAPYKLLSDNDGLNLKDARIGAAEDHGPTGTFNNFDLNKTDGPAIDHIFVDRALKVSRFTVLTEGFNGKVISDHFPIIADVILP